MAVDNTHTKYLRGSDKKSWNNYADALKAQKKLGNFLDGFALPKLKDGEEYEVPVRKTGDKKNNKK